MSTAMTADHTATRNSTVTVLLCYLIALFEGFDLQAAGVAAPLLAPAFHLAPAQLGWFFSASTFGLMAGAALGGRLSDRFGRKAVLVASVATFGVMSLLNGVAGSIEALLATRFLTGFGIGGALPNIVALTAENTLPGKKNAAIGLLYAGLPSGGALASLTAALFASAGWQRIFFVGGAAPLLAVPLIYMIMPDSGALQQAQAAHRAETPGRRGFVFALFGEHRATRTLLLWLGCFLALLTMYMLLNWMPTLLVGKGLSRPDASLVQLSFNVGGAVASVLTGLLMERMKMARVILLAFIAAAAGLLLLSGVSADLAAALAVGSLVGATMSATQAILYAIAPGSYPTEVRGTGVGSAVSVGRLGSAVGPLIAAMLLGAGRSPQEVLILLVPVILTAGIALLVLVAVAGEHRSGVDNPAQYL